MHPDELNGPDVHTMRRTELLGHLAAAARLALQDCESADGVDFAVVAGPLGMQVECNFYVDGHAIGGWGV